MKKAKAPQDLAPAFASLMRAVFELMKLPPNLSVARLWFDRATDEAKAAGIEVEK